MVLSNTIIIHQILNAIKMEKNSCFERVFGKYPIINVEPKQMPRVKNVILSKPLLTISDYPVGRNLIQTMFVANSMADELNKLFLQITKLYQEGTYGSIDLPPHITLFCQGSSGAILAALVAARCSFVKEILHLKKPGEKSHAASFEKAFPNSFNFFIDDHIASGYTIEMCCKNFLYHNPGKKCNGIIVSSIVFEKDIPCNVDYLICGQYDQAHAYQLFADQMPF